MSSKDEIFDYVMSTPENTNPAVLKNMLDDLPSEGGGWTEVEILHATNLQWEYVKGQYQTDIPFEGTPDISPDGEFCVTSFAGNEYEWLTEYIPVEPETYILFDNENVAFHAELVCRDGESWYFGLDYTGEEPTFNEISISLVRRARTSQNEAEEPGNPILPGGGLIDPGSAIEAP